MNFKKIFATAVAAMSLFATVGTSSAVDLVNMYGASAQYILWSQQAGPYLTSIGCTGAQTAFMCKQTVPGTCDVPFVADEKSFIAKASCSGADTYFRFSAEASYGGVCAMNNNFINVPPYGAGGNPNCDAACGGDATQRSMIDEASCNFTTQQCTAKKCVTVNAGASDVPVECFTQQSEGYKLGPLGGSWMSRDFVAAPVSSSETDVCKPLAVPFAFFANKSTVTKGGATISNINKDTADVIFAGQIQDWADMVDTDGTHFDPQPITVCLRHAGSGTHASIDAYITGPLIVLEDSPATGSGPYAYYFNNGSSDMMKCVNGSGTWSGDGAIGYADADQSMSSDTVRLTLNGVTPSKATIAGGAYNFYGLQQIYGVTSGSSLCAYASNPARIASNPVWTSRCKMEYQRIDPCESFPLQQVPIACP